MATLQFQFETGAIPLTRIVDAICSEYNYQATINGVPNPETKANFARRMIKEHIIKIVRNQDFVTARNTAEATITPITLT